MKQLLARIALENPNLAARLVAMTMPAIVDRVPASFDLIVRDVGAWRVAGGHMQRLNGQTDSVDFRLATDAEGLAALVTGGGSAMKLMVTGRVRIRGSRRKAGALRELGEAGDVTIADGLRAGGELDADAVHRALPYLIDPAWTRGHTFVVGYHVDPGGSWYVHVGDGAPLVVATDRPRRVDADVNAPAAAFAALLLGDLTPSHAMRDQAIHVRGDVHAVTRLSRWVDRSQGRDRDEIRREERQRLVQANRVGTWGSHPEAAIGQGELLGYGELYALWERENWRAHELDFTVDKEHWLATPGSAQEDLIWSLGSLAIGEERVTAKLAPFVSAAPSGEVEVFLATQLVDEARHTAFLDRFGGEVVGLSSDDLRGRTRELGERMRAPWSDFFDASLGDVARRVQARPGDVALFAEGVATCHLIVKGFLAMTGQRFILEYLERHRLYPGFRRGLELLERDEHRHVAFGVRFLRDAIAADPAIGDVVQRRVAALAPVAAGLLVPPYARSPREFVSYGHDSNALYGFAYGKLARRMYALGLECPPADELMPGPIATPAEARAAGAPA